MVAGWGKPLIAAVLMLSSFGATRASAVERLPIFAPTMQATYAAIGSETSIPYGWIGFCRRYRGECDHGTLPAEDINLSAKAAREINRINLWVNKNVQPVSDWDHWHVADQWDYPTDGKGDCEDYALFKRRLLIALGFPRQALLITVVKDEHGEGHAILTVKTNHGEFILDNLTDRIKPWADTPYRFVKRQSQTDENVWVQIGPPTEEPAVVSR
jgi:predicted transglutaminase-like cysteine proteinase